jgi:hypothetical protein
MYYAHYFWNLSLNMDDSKSRRDIKMEKVVVVGCGSYMDQGYGCPGEWRCLKAASLGDGTFESPSQVVAFVKCECPGRTVVPSIGMAMKLSQIKPDKIYAPGLIRKIQYFFHHAIIPGGKDLFIDTVPG